MYRLLLMLSLICSNCGAMKILLVCPLPVRSLNILCEGYVRHLREAGHELTYITAFPLQNPPSTNFQQIDVSKNMEYIADDLISIASVINGESHITDIESLQLTALNVAVGTFKNEKVQNLVNDKKVEFDVIMADFYETELYSGLSAVYDCPMVWCYSMGAHGVTLKLIDEATNPAYTTDYLSSNVPPLKFVQRVQELWYQIKWNFYKRFIVKPLEEAAYKHIYGPLLSMRGRSLPEYDNLIYNASLVLANEYYGYGNIPSTPQNFKFVGGQHIEKPSKPLEANIQNLMDNSEHGVIYFSMGSNWKSKDIPKELTEDLIKMFGELKETVIWKYEEKLDNLPKNVHIFPWAPQQSILDHPKCLFFITHGGLLSSTEAVHFGVPIIGVPIGFDQFINIHKAHTNGYALLVDLNFDLAVNLKTAIKTMLTNSSYGENAKRLSQIYYDRVVPPGTELVHWVEHVVRTRGAPHLRSPALHVPFYQKMYLDLAALVFGVLTVLVITVRSQFFGRKGRSNLKKKKN